MQATAPVFLRQMHCLLSKFRRVTSIAACSSLLGLASAAPVGATLAVPTQPPGGMTELRKTLMPSVSLRGYGSLAGEFVEYGSADHAATASVLFLRCENPAKAALALAKYRSDLGSLPGVTEKTAPFEGKPVPLLMAAGQGYFLALRQGASVVVVASARSRDLTAVLKALGFATQKELDFTGAQVPAYLQKFDRWGFGFWMGDPLAAPAKQDQTYDVREKFDWAKKMGVALQIDAQLSQGGGAQGELDDNSRRWSIDLARDLGIPVAVQMQGAPAPGWIVNRFGDEMQRKVPQFIGGWYGVNGNNSFPGSPLGQLSWASVAGKDQLFAAQYQAVHRYKGYDNVTSYGEWHGEVGEGALAMFMDYGPVADTRYRDFLRQQYGDITVVDQRWSGGKGLIKSWDDVRMPEPAEFLGWNERAIDLQGEWRLCYVEDLPAEAKDNWFAPDLKDDGWRKLIVPGDDHQLTKAKWRTRTIFRRTVSLSGDELARLKASGHAYLYAWTLEEAPGKSMGIALNGQRLADQKLNSRYPWVAIDVINQLRAGCNQISLALPLGELSYRIYLSPDAPISYPALGPERNAQWVDYRDFITWMREDGLRRSIEAIRREDPDKFIKLYSPGAITDVMKGLAEDYGCYFHDTGGMSGNWNDRLPALMRSSGLPMSLEPGNPAYDLPTLKLFFGRWMTEGLNTLDYFMSIGDILWRPDQKAWFEAHQPLVHLLGKCHYPQAEVAVLEGARSHRLTGFPWDSIDSGQVWGGRRNGLGTLYSFPDPRDAINESDFLRGTVKRYRVIVDDSTLIMDDDLIAKIEAWVRAGGTFITQGQSGRHSSTVADSWPISRLTGYKVIGENGNGRVAALPGQPIFTNPRWSQTDAGGRPVVGAAGVLYEKVAPECRDILTWAGGAGIAMGIRPLGKGRIITMGTAMPRMPGAWEELLKWCGVVQPAAPGAPGCRVARAISNNGLYDVYTVWAENLKESGTVTLTIPGRQTSMLNLQTGTTVTGTVAGDVVEFRDLLVEPLETYAFLAPRKQVDEAPLSWFKLQCDWWQGTKNPAPAPVVRPWPNTVSLDADWAFQPVTGGLKEAAPFLASTVDDSQWPRMPLGIWYGKRYPATKTGVFRRRFTVPADWGNKGQTWLWIYRRSGPISPAPYKSQVLLDGQPVFDSGAWVYAICSLELTARLTPGEHQLAVATEGNSPVSGIAANMWLEHVPEPDLRQPLDGDWNGSRLPGITKPLAGDLTRQFTPMAGTEKKRALLFVETTDNRVLGVFLNGRLLNRDLGGQHFQMDLTPYLKHGELNSLTLNLMYGDQKVTVKSVEIRYYSREAL